MSEPKPKSKRGGYRPGAGRKPKHLSPSKAKKRGEKTPAEQAHDVVKEMLKASGEDWLKAAAAKIPDAIEEPEYGAKRTAEYNIHHPPETKPKTGRPTDYKPEFDTQAEKLCRLGATDEELADFFKVDVRSIYRWAQKHEKFCQAIKSGKEMCDERVERSLYHRAVGYTHDAVKIFMPAGAEKPVYAAYKEHVPPDVTAAKLWLINRRPDIWRDRQEVDVNSEGLAAMLDRAKKRAAETQNSVH